MVRFLRPLDGRAFHGLHAYTTRISYLTGVTHDMGSN